MVTVSNLLCVQLPTKKIPEAQNTGFQDTRKGWLPVGMLPMPYDYTFLSFHYYLLSIYIVLYLYILYLISVSFTSCFALGSFLFNYISIILLRRLNIAVDYAEQIFICNAED